MSRSFAKWMNKGSRGGQVYLAQMLLAARIPAFGWVGRGGVYVPGHYEDRMASIVSVLQRLILPSAESDGHLGQETRRGWEADMLNAGVHPAWVFNIDEFLISQNFPGIEELSGPIFSQGGLVPGCSGLPVKILILMLRAGGFDRCGILDARKDLYDSSVTNRVAALQAFLRIDVTGVFCQNTIHRWEALSGLRFSRFTWEDLLRPTTIVLSLIHI